MFHKAKNELILVVPKKCTGCFSLVLRYAMSIFNIVLVPHVNAISF